MDFGSLIGVFLVYSGPLFWLSYSSLERKKKVIAFYLQPVQRTRPVKP